MIRAISWDFHNTLVRCDAWLELEVHTLAGEAVRWLAANSADRCVRDLLDGTERSRLVLEEADASYAALRQQAKQSGIEVSAKAALEQVLPMLGVDVAEAELNDALASLQRACLADIAPMPGVPEALAQLADLPMVIVSSAAYPPFVDWALDKLSLRPYFQAIITSAAVGYYKSDVRIYQAALATLPGIAPDEVVHVGDSLPYDVATAKAAGMRTIWYNPADKQAPADAAQADAATADLVKLPQLIQSLSLP